jgi:putative ABC transport system permease protein
MSEDDQFSIKGLPAEAGVVEALGIAVIAGRDFAENPPMPDSANFQYLLNETLVQQLGWTPDDAIGRRMLEPRVGEVIGVVQDFNFNTLHVPIEPLAIWYSPRDIGRIVARIVPGQTDPALQHIRETWERFAPGVPFSYRFIDDVYNLQYEDERRMSGVLSIFAAIAILVACLGLLGLASFTAEKRTREIGVRKVLGASVPGIVGLLSRDFLVLVAIAFLAAAPLTWIALQKWLGGFAYQVDVGVGVFLLAGVAILVIALATVSTQAIRAATANPVKSLRYE